MQKLPAGLHLDKPVANEKPVTADPGVACFWIQLARLLQMPKICQACRNAQRDMGKSFLHFAARKRQHLLHVGVTGSHGCQAVHRPESGLQTIRTAVVKQSTDSHDVGTLQDCP